MRRFFNLFVAGLAVTVLFNSVTVYAGHYVTGSTTLGYLLEDSANGIVFYGDEASGNYKVATNFQNLVQIGDINLDPYNIGVNVISKTVLGKVEHGIRFSGNWLLEDGPKFYDMSFDFDARIHGSLDPFSDNTLEVTGGISGDGTVTIAENVTDPLTLDTLANKLVKIHPGDVNTIDHQKFPDYVREISVSKDLAMETYAIGDDAFVSHFDQTFSQGVPEPGSFVLAGLGAMGLLGMTYGRRRRTCRK